MGAKCRVAVYSGMNEDTLVRLDTLDFEEFIVGGYMQPGVGHNTDLIYISVFDARERGSMYEVKYESNKLALGRHLTCVKDSGGLAVISADTLYVYDRHDKTVCLVDLNQDRVTARLHVPYGLSIPGQIQIAVLGDTILASYGSNLVIYRHGIPTPVKLVPTPYGLWAAFISTDNHSAFLVFSWSSSDVRVMDISGKLIHTIPVPEGRHPIHGDRSGVRACTVVGRQLWVACINGDMVVMSSQL